MPRARTLLAALGALLMPAALLAPGTAHAGFAPANDPVASSFRPFVSGIATDPAGNTLTAWTDSGPEGEPPYKPMARWVSASGGVGALLELSSTGSGDYPQVAIAPSGRGFAVWRLIGDPHTLLGRWIEPDGTLGPLLTVVPPDPVEMRPVEFDLVAGPTGVITIVWRNDADQDLYARQVQPDGAMGPIITGVGFGGRDPQLGALPDGSTVVVWRNIGTELNVITPGGEAGTQMTISSTTVTARPFIAVDALGNGLVVWRENNGMSFSARGRLLTPSGAPVGEELVFDPNGPEGLFVDVELGVTADSAGDFLVSWSRQVGDNDYVVYARGVNSSGVFTGPPQPVSPSGSVTSFEKPMLSDSGVGAVVWNSFEPGANTNLGRTVTAGGTPTADVIPLQSPGRGYLLASTVPALGFAAFVIPVNDGAVLRRYLEPPLCADATVTLRAERSTTISLPCSGAGMESLQVATGPARGTATPLDPAVPSVRYALGPGAGGNDSFTYAVGNDGGVSGIGTVSVLDRIRPAIRKLKLVRDKKGRVRLIGALSEPAKVHVKVFAKGRKGKRRKLGSVRNKKAAKKLRIRIRARLAKKLAAGGRLRLVSVATDTAGNRSKPRRQSLRLKAKRR